MYHRYYDLYFTTATILEWKHLLRSDKMKDVVIESLRFLVREKRAVVYDFVIMPNHIHLVWHIPEEYTLRDVKAALLSYTAHQFKKILKSENPALLEEYRVNLSDREYQFCRCWRPRQQQAAELDAGQKTPTFTGITHEIRLARMATTAKEPSKRQQNAFISFCQPPFFLREVSKHDSEVLK